MELAQSSSAGVSTGCKLLLVWNHLLVHDDTNRIVEQALSEDDGVQLWVDLILIEYGQYGDRIRCG